MMYASRFFTLVPNFILLSLLSSFSSSTPLQTSQQPNIIFILADDYGYHDIGYHGSRIRTPNLDSLAAEGVRLENYYVQPMCTPTRSQLLSGRYQIHTGLQHSVIWAYQANALPRDSPTLADKLQEAGYSTHAVGKWHLGFYKEEFLPTNRGFQSFYGYLTGSEDYYTHKLCDDKSCGLDLYEDTKPVYTENGTYSPFLFNQRATDIIERHATNSDSSKPLFLYLSYPLVHEPLQVPAKYMEQYQDIEDEDRRTYAGMVSCMDEAVSNLTTALQKWGLWNNTLLIFSSDNGGKISEGGNNWPLRGGKNSLWEGGMKGVGFIHSQRFLKRGAIHEGFMHVSDWYPTLVEGVAGGTLNGTKPLDGYNQWTSLKEGSPSLRAELLHNIDILTPLYGKNQFPGVWDTRVNAGLRVGDMKLITGNPGNGTRFPPPEEELMMSEGDFDPLSENSLQARQEGAPQNVWLFNITADPEERHDLSSSYPQVVHELLLRLAQYNATAVPPRFPPRDPNSDPAKNGGLWGPWE